MSGFVLENHSTYCSLELNDGLLRMTWEQTENSTRRAIELIQESGLQNLIVVAPSLSELPDGIFACLLRIWKSLHGNVSQFIFITPSAAVKNELEAGGLLKYWKVIETREAALQFLRLSDTAEFDLSSVNGRELSETGSAADKTLQFDEHKTYCVIECGAQLSNLSWSDFEAAVSDMISRFESSPASGLLLDFSSVNHINSGMIAGLVRFWKVTQKKEGQFVVVSPNDGTTSVLTASGLGRVWSIVDDREDGAFVLGVSQQAVAEKRERTLLVMVSGVCSVIATLVLIPMFMNRETVLGVNSQLAALLLSSAALATGTIASLKEDGIRRKLSIAAVSLSLLILSTLWFRDNPISFMKPQVTKTNFDE